MHDTRKELNCSEIWFGRLYEVMSQSCGRTLRRRGPTLSSLKITFLFTVRGYALVALKAIKLPHEYSYSREYVSCFA